MKKAVISSLVFCLFITPLFSEKLDLAIKYLGITAVKVQMVDNGKQITTHARATGLASIVAQLDNYYITEYEENYLPTSYKKIITQKDYLEDRITFYDRENFVAVRNDNILHEKFDYKIHQDSRDFFAALYQLRFIPELDSGYLWLDANKLIWRAKYKLIKKESIKTVLGKKDALVIELDFEKISASDKENTDMLTNNLVDEDKNLIFWISDDDKRIPLKAKFTMKPFAVSWELLKYEE